MSTKWKVWFSLHEATSTGGFGKVVGRSEVYEITTEHNNPDAAKEVADERFAASPRIYPSAGYQEGGTYLRYANIEELK